MLKDVSSGRETALAGQLLYGLLRRSMVETDTLSLVLRYRDAPTRRWSVLVLGLRGPIPTPEKHMSWTSWYGIRYAVPDVPVGRFEV